MKAEEFFWLVARMRETQRDYFDLREQKILRSARMLERQVDAEIERVKKIVHEANKC